MTEADWLTLTDLQAMLAYLQGYWTDATGRHRHDPPALSLATERKLRLFACACRELCTCSLKEEWDAKSWIVFTDVENCPCTHAARAALLRCIFGNPWRSVAFKLKGLNRETEAFCHIRPMARMIYAERCWDDLPILADALEEAGCDSADLLAHLRGPGPHARGCWALDLILGKE